MKVTVKLDRNAVRRISEAAKMAALETLKVLYTDLTNETKTMPFDDGDMQNHQTFVVVEGEDEINGIPSYFVSLVTGSPQARRLYYHPEYKFQQGKNPNAGAFWLEPYISGEKSEFVETRFAEIFREKAGL